ncbi:PD-(D/E)XK nuclease family protein [Corallococcus exiguus]|uniref:PD-(D/E)XK nuclease family protein n=1 Tax=Corallococcus exiguus TaxID=83462 RepID=UPI003DA27DE7
MNPARDAATFQVVDELGISRLGALLGTGACKRKALDRHAALPGKTPSALLGTLRHWILEAAIQGWWRAGRTAAPVSLASWGDLESNNGRRVISSRLVEEAVEHMDRELDQTEPWRAPLSRAWAPIAWHNVLTQLRSLALARLSLKPAPCPTGGGAPPNLVRGLKRPEVPLGSKSLHLRGAADFVEWPEDDIVRISDFKSGGVLDPEGQLKEGYILQLQGYALALHDAAHPRPKGFRLEVVSDGGVFDVDGRTETLDYLRRKLENQKVPWGQQAVAVDYETAGPSCMFCPQRPRCSSYTKYAEEAWESNRVGVGQRPLPLDIWGVVESVEEGPTTLHVRIRSPEGERRLIAGLAHRHFLSRLCQVGEPIWIYGLQTLEGARGGQFVHPLNFHEEGTKPWTSAWTTQVLLTK